MHAPDEARTRHIASLDGLEEECLPIPEPSAEAEVISIRQ